MDLPRRYDPPDKVVAPAFAELLQRLRIYRAAGDSQAVPEEERRLFDHGVAARRRVLEHTLLLTFGQWAVYRQAISRVPYRAVRALYAVTAFATTTAFARRRATAVWQDLFAHIATSPLDSAIANEARVVLAELEGPDGPYFRQLCRDRKFDHDLAAAVAALDAADLDQNKGAASGLPHVSAHDVHAQLRLRPRLLLDSPDAPHAADPNHPPSPPRQRQRLKHRQQQQQQRQQQPPQGMPPNLESWPAPPTRDDSWEVPRSRPLLVRSRAPRGDDDDSRMGLDDDATSLPGATGAATTPFDFAAAARDFAGHDHDTGADDAYGASTDAAFYDTGFVDDGDESRSGAGMTPAQQRAAERRARRARARANSTSRAAERDAE